MSRKKSDIKEFGLIKHRHDMPVDDYIYFHVQNPTQTQRLYYEASWAILPYRDRKIVIYVTGLTVALIEAMKVCTDYEIDLDLMHYNPKDKTYYCQEVYRWKK